MLNPEKIMELLKYGSYGEIQELCKKEIIANSTKERGGNELEKRRKAFVKYVEHCIKSNQHREQIAGFFYTNVQGERMQTATDAYSAICIPESKAFEGAAHSSFKDEEINFNVGACFPQDWKFFDTIRINPKEFNAILKVIKGEGKSCEFRGKKAFPVCKLGNGYFNMELAKRIFDILGDCTLYVNPKPLAPSVAYSEIGLGLILPINATGSEEKYVDYLEKLKEEYEYNR